LPEAYCSTGAITAAERKGAGSRRAGETPQKLLAEISEANGQAWF